MNAKELFEQFFPEHSKNVLYESKDIEDFSIWLLKQVAERLKGLQRDTGSSIWWEDLESVISELENPGK